MGFFFIRLITGIECEFYKQDIGVNGSNLLDIRHVSNVSYFKTLSCWRLGDSLFYELKICSILLDNLNQVLDAILLLFQHLQIKRRKQGQLQQSVVFFSNKKINLLMKLTEEFYFQNRACITIRYVNLFKS